MSLPRQWWNRLDVRLEGLVCQTLPLLLRLLQFFISFRDVLPYHVDLLCAQPCHIFHTTHLIAEYLSGFLSEPAYHHRSTTCESICSRHCLPDLPCMNRALVHVQSSSIYAVLGNPLMSTDTCSSIHVSIWSICFLYSWLLTFFLLFPCFSHIQNSINQEASHAHFKSPDQVGKIKQNRKK